MATGDAIAQVKQLEDIKFPEFTSKLITDTFDALINANVRQLESYLELFKTVNQGLTKYINDTKNDVPADKIIDFLINVVPSDNPENPEEAKELTKVKIGGELSPDDATKLNKAIKITKKPGDDPDDAPAENPGEHPDEEIPQGTIDESKYKAIIDAVAKRISADKFDMLKFIMNQALLRLVVDSGEIETKLTFNTVGTQSSEQVEERRNEITTNRNVNARGWGTFGYGFLRGSGSYNSTTLTVNTLNQKNTDSANTDISIFGHVKIHFKTDYSPLNIEPRK